MNNDYQDYQLDDMEDQAVNRSNNFKKAAIIGGAVLGVGGTAAFAATKLNPDAPTDELTEEDILDAANAGAVDEGVINETQTVTQTAQPAAEQHVHHHHHIDQPQQPGGGGTDGEVVVEETGIVVDEEGNVINTFDRGTIDGKDFIVMDTNGNGAADVLAYDENGNGIFEDHEIVKMDDQSYEMGQGRELHAYYQDQEGNLNNIDDLVFADRTPAHEDDGLAIHNDFHEDKEGEYFDDLAHNNPDYRNNESNDYSAGMDAPVAQNHGGEYDTIDEIDYDGTPESSYVEDEMAFVDHNENNGYEHTDDFDASDDYVHNDFMADATDSDSDNGFDAGFDDGHFDA